MFWGLIMEPNKRYTQTVEKPFHISQAAMDISTGDTEPCQVMVVVDGKNFLVCTLQKGKTIQVPLDLYFKAGDGISFLTNGKCNVHLTGYLDPEFEDEEDDEEAEEEEEEEVPELVPAKNKRKLEAVNDVVNNKKAKKDKKSKKADSSDSEDEEDQLQKLLDGDDIDTDDNDDSFKVNTSTEADSDEEESDDEEDEEDEDVEEEQEDSDEEAETTLDTSKDESKTESQIDMSKLSKSQRRRLKKKLSQEKANKEQPKVNGVDKPKKEQQKPEKKKPEAKKEEVVEKKEKKGLSGGVQIEDLKVGSGPMAKPGKLVMVYYEGRLKQNNKMFDNCNKGPGFKFKLGGKEVISGWDIGVNGMKVGGKRRIVCPPAMAYGAKGSPPVIPPNSTLVFEVELKNVK